MLAQARHARVNFDLDSADDSQDLVPVFRAPSSSQRSRLRHCRDATPAVRPFRRSPVLAPIHPPCPQGAAILLSQASLLSQREGSAPLADLRQPIRHLGPHRLVLHELESAPLDPRRGGLGMHGVRENVRLEATAAPLSRLRPSHMLWFVLCSSDASTACVLTLTCSGKSAARSVGRSLAPQSRCERAAIAQSRSTQRTATWRGRKSNSHDRTTQPPDGSRYSFSLPVGIATDPPPLAPRQGGIAAGWLANLGPNCNGS